MRFFGMIKSFFAPKTPAQKLGIFGERKAAKFLKKRGMRILAKNYRCGRDEVDIVALDNNQLVIIEVKTRTKNALVDGYFAALSKTKKTGVRNCIKKIYSQNKTLPRSWRYDIVDIRVDSQTSSVEIKHFENIRI